GGSAFAVGGAAGKGGTGQAASAGGAGIGGKGGDAGAAGGGAAGLSGAATIGLAATGATPADISAPVTTLAPFGSNTAAVMTLAGNPNQVNAGAGVTANAVTLPVLANTQINPAGTNTLTISGTFTRFGNGSDAAAGGA